MAFNGLGRSLYVGLKADTKSFGKSLSTAEKNLQRFKNGVKVLGTAVAASFAAMGAAALLFGKSAITAALEDQKSQVLLARTIKNNAKARKGLIKDSEKTVNALQNQFNITDDKLRPAFAKLVIATKSVSKSQKIIRTAIDISAQSGKSLDAEVSALSRAYLGSNTAVGKLGLGIDKAKLKTMKFTDIIKAAQKATGGAGKAQANTFQGSVDGLKIAWTEFQESVGYKILPKLGTLLTYIKTKLVPFLGVVRDGFDGIAKDKNSPAAKLGASIKTMFLAFQNLFNQIGGSKGKDAASSLELIATAFTKLADGITTTVNAFASLKDMYKNIPGPLKYLIEHTPNLISIPKYLSTPKGGNTPPPLNPNATPSDPFGIKGKPTYKPTSMVGTGNTTIVLNGIIDSEASRRVIEKVLQQSSLRTGNVVVNRKVFNA
jgi:hypothetical protein